MKEEKLWNKKVALGKTIKGYEQTAVEQIDENGGRKYHLRGFSIRA